jgi:hypothetical protein
LDDNTLRFPGRQVVGYSGHWTTAGETERLAFIEARSMRWQKNQQYLGFPWFSLIHAVETDDIELSSKLLAMLGVLKGKLSGDVDIISLSEHPRTLDFLKYFDFCGVTSLFYPHLKNGTTLSGIQLLPFPLFPLQNEPGFDVDSADRTYLANFFGTQGAGEYHSEVRRYIFSLRGTPDLRIVERPSWHHQRLVDYELRRSPLADDSTLIEEFEFEKQYRNAMKSSHFALCPSGRGLLSTRIYEALGLGSIPIIIASEPCLPGDQSLWESASLIVGDSPGDVDHALTLAREMSVAERSVMKSKGTRLFKSLSKFQYGRFMQETIQREGA